MTKRTGLILAAAVAVFFSSWTICVSAADKAPDASAVFDSMYKKIDTVKNYKLTFDYEETKTEKSKGTSRVCDFWFVEPDLIKMVIVDGDDKGSKVAYNGIKNDKAVRAKQSFMPLPISVKKNDPRLAGFFVSDWKSELIDIKKKVGAVKPKSAGEGKIKDRLAYKIVFDGLKGEFDKIILWVDKKDSVLLQYEYYLNGTMKQRKTWHDIDLDAKLTEEDFKL